MNSSNSPSDVPRFVPPICDHCGRPHKYTCYQVVGTFVFWFCEPEHRTAYMRRVPLSYDAAAEGVA